MKKKISLILASVIVSAAAFSQFTYKIKADSVLITKDSCNAELILENGTRNVRGFLYNYGNGRTRFQSGLLKIDDTTYVIGIDTLRLSNSSFLARNGLNRKGSYVELGGALTKSDTLSNMDSSLVFFFNNGSYKKIGSIGNYIGNIEKYTNGRFHIFSEKSAAGNDYWNWSWSIDTLNKHFTMEALEPTWGFKWDIRTFQTFNGYNPRPQVPFSPSDAYARLGFSFYNDGGGLYINNRVNGVQVPIFNVDLNGKMRLHISPDNGTSADSLLVWDAVTKRVNKIAQSSLVSAITANNGVTANTSTNVQLGGALTQVTTIAAGTNNLKVTGTIQDAANAVFNVTNTVGSSGTGNAGAILASSSGGVTGGNSFAIKGIASGGGYGIWGTSAGGYALLGQSTNGAAVGGYSANATGVYGEGNLYGVYGHGFPNGIGVYAEGGNNGSDALKAQANVGGLAANLITTNSEGTASNALTVLKVTRTTTGTAANGIGVSIDMNVRTTVQERLSHQLISKWTDATDASRTSQFEIIGVNNGVSARKLALAGTGRLTLDGYGSGTFGGTVSKFLAVDGTGNVIETTGSGGGISGITAENGLTANTSTNVQLGGALTQPTVINADGDNNLLILGSSSSDGLLQIYNGSTGASDRGFTSTADGGLAIAGIATGSNVGIYGESQSGYGLHAATNSTGPGAGLFQLTENSSSSVRSIATFQHFVNTASNGIGVSLDLNSTTSTGANRVSNQIVSKWNNATDASRTSGFEIWGVNNGAAIARRLALAGNGQLTLDGYGSGTFSGTVSKYLAVDGNGNVIETTGGGSGGIATLNGLIGTTQTFATGTTGTDFNISSSGTTHTFNIPDASTSARGLVTTGTQTFAGNKTFSALASGGTAPTTTGTTKMVISDANGLLSFANFPSGYSAIQEDGGSALQARSNLNFGYGVKAADNSIDGRTDVGVELTNAESFLSSDVTLSSVNTFSDAASLTLAAGTWMIAGSATVESTNNNPQRVTYKLWDGTTVYQAGEATSNSMGGSIKGYVCLPVSCIVVLSTSTTVRFSVASTLVSSVIKATPGDNNGGTTGKATSMRAVRIK
jgi:hypothetical protein